MSSRPIRTRGPIMYALLAVLAVLALAVAAISYQTSQASERQQRRENLHDCIERQRLYDGHIVFAQFLGGEFRASQDRIDQGIARLRMVLGPRPKC